MWNELSRCPSLTQLENGEVPTPPLGASVAVAAAAQVGRDRLGDAGSTSSAGSVSSLPASPAQAIGYRGHEGSFEARYQSPLDDFRVSQETLLEAIDPQNRRWVQLSVFVHGCVRGSPRSSFQVLQCVLFW